MQQIVREHQAYPPKIVASVTSWELWKTLKGKDLTDQCDLVELRVDALPPELTTEQVMEFRPYMPYAAAMDIEIKAMRHARELVMEARERDVIIIGSTHDFQITPGVDYLREQEKKARSYKADIVKFAFTPCLASDIQTGVQLFTKPKGPIAVMGMGPMGPVSRLLYSQLGSCLVYGYLGEEETAPGQWHVSLIKETLRRLGPILR